MDCAVFICVCVCGARSREEACHRASLHSVQLTFDLLTLMLTFFLLLSLFFFFHVSLSSVTLLQDGGTRGRRSAMEADLKMKK